MSKISRIYVKNIKAIAEQEINLNGCSAIITAGNNKGKTTLLNVLPDRIRSQKVPVVIKEGETEGKAEMTLDNGDRFIWEIKPGKETLLYVTADGVCSTSVREISKRFFPEKFDIDKFLTESPKKQAEMLQKLAGIDFTELDKQYKAAYDNRTYWNKAHKEAEAQLAPVDKLLPENEINIDELKNKFVDCSSHNAEIDAANYKLSSIEEEIKCIRVALITAENKYKSFIDSMKELGEKIDISELSRQIGETNQLNKQIDANNRAKAAQLEHQKMAQKANEAEAMVKSVEQQKKDLLTKAALPDGITITEDGLLVDGLPLERNQLSLSKIYITALKLAALSLGEVKALYFDASPLDKKSLSEIQAWAEANDLQLLIERPDFNGGEITYEIIKENN